MVPYSRKVLLSKFVCKFRCNLCIKYIYIFQVFLKFYKIFLIFIIGHFSPKYLKKMIYFVILNLASLSHLYYTELRETWYWILAQKLTAWGGQQKTETRIVHFQQSRLKLRWRGTHRGRTLGQTGAILSVI